ncbi:MAG: hypothetical protein ABIP78_08560 [Pyrinomonadaceae bacterium]
MKITISAFALVFLCSFTPIFAQTAVISVDAQRILDTKFRSWRLAEVKKEIVDFYKREFPYEQPNSIKGDWNGDGKIDYAVQLQNRQSSESQIIVVLMKSRSGFDTYFLEAADCIGSEKKGSKGYNFDAQQSFRYKHDAIFSAIWEKAGTTYIWEKGRFRGILTSD